MKALIVHAHPEDKSFCTALKNTAGDFFSSNGNEVKVSDLYKMGFNPVGSKDDFKEAGNPDFFKYQLEQSNALTKDLFTDDIKAEMEKFVWADVVIFNFPLWWFSVPAIMKGWVDRVFAMGFCYGAGKGVYENGTFRDKTSFLCLTTGGPEQSYQESGFNGDINKILFHVNHGMLHFVGMKVLPQFVCYGAARITEEERKSKLEEYKAYLANINTTKPIFE
ncbi:MAG: NAD(P)H-dependent oxidoreductase [Ignavibacteria bacterium]